MTQDQWKFKIMDQNNKIRFEKLRVFDLYKVGQETSYKTK